MSGRKTCHHRKPPWLKNTKNRPKLRHKANSKFQNGDGTTVPPTETEAQLQIMSGLLHQNSSGENSLSPSEKILMRRILVTWLEKVQQDLNKFEHLRYSGYKDHCTIHGLYDVFISKSYLERFIWILTLVGCFILAIMCSKIAVNEWYQSIETTNTYFESWDLNMPDIIICPDLLLKKSEIDTLLDGAVAEDDEYKTKFLNPKRPGNLQDKFKFYTRKVKEMKRFIDYSTMIEHAEFPNMYLPFLPRNYPDRVLSLVEQGNAYEDAKMVFGNNTDFYLLKEFFRMQHIWGANYNERLNLSKIAYQCDSIFLTYDASLRVLKLFQNKTFNKLSFSRTLRNLIPNLDEILNVTERNFTDQEILSLHGIINFCNSEYVKETFDYHHKCYRFDSKEIFLSNDKNSIGIILPNDTVHGLLGEKGLWFSIVHDSRDITGKLIPKEEIDEIGPIQTSAINNLSWVYIRPGAHTVNIDATRNLILRDLPGSRCHDIDLQYNYNYTKCVEQTCEPIKNKIYHTCMLSIKADSEVDAMHKSCMKMPSDVEKDYNECVKKCEKYCDFWTYMIADVQSQKFNPEIADRFLTTNPSELDSRYYIRLLYQHGRYTHTEQAYKITFIEFIANIGGISGFCVGMSIMSLFQIFLYLLMAKVGNLQRRKSNRKSNSKQDYQKDENQFNDESSGMIEEELRSSA